MKGEKAIELSTYVLVLLSAVALLPLLARWLDGFILPARPVFATSPAMLTFGILLALLGWGLGLWTVYLFKTLGGGTPNPARPPRRLICSGPYAIVRNPMVLGGFYLLLGQAVLYASPSLLGLAGLYLLCLYGYVRWVEEPALVRRFGQPYRDYLARVPRFFPDPRRWKRP